VTDWARGVAATPSVSIVIAVKNAAATLDGCLKSCIEQDYEPKELIVIDGGSTDGSLEKIRAHASALAYFVSEPDRGIYHAWNKALKLIQGEWVCFLGADDYWLKPTSLSEMMALAQYPEVNFVCSQIVRIPGEGWSPELFGGHFDRRGIKWGMTVAHTGMLHHRSLFDEFGLFDESYRIAGDYEFLLRAAHAIRSAYWGKPTVAMGTGGISSTRQRIVFEEGRRALACSGNGGLFWAWWFFIRAWSKYLLKYSFRRAVGGGSR